MKYRQWNPTHPFAAKVAQELHKRAWTARKLAAAMGVAPCSVGRVLNGWRKPSLSWRVRACRALGWPVPDHCTPPPAEPRPLPHYFVDFPKESPQVADKYNDTEGERHMKAHRHRPVGEPRVTAYTGSVATGSTRENRAAHGNVRVEVRCRCGAVRRSNVNGRHVESSGWLDEQEGEGE